MDAPTLLDLRRKIDAIDGRLHELIRERADLVGSISAAKPAGGLALRPGREAQIMARLKDGPQTVPQMVARNYADTPLHLHAAAGRSMLAHLIQMVKDGRVKTEDGQARIDSVYRL